MSETELEKRGDESEALVIVAFVARTRGLKGELVADVLTDFPERFESLETVVALFPDGSRQPVDLEEHWFQRDRIILKFAGYDSIEAAKALVGCQIGVPESERIALEAGEFYDWELAGCEVKNAAGDLVGRVREVMRTAGVEMLVIENSAGREMLVPMARDICTEIDVAAKVIRIDPPEGLLEL